MDHTSTFDLFARSTFGIEPHGQIGAALERLASSMRIPKGGSAPLDRTEAQVAFVSSGTTKLSAIASLGREQIVAFHFAGDIVTVSADDIYAYQLTALTESSLLVFPAGPFFDQVANDRRMARALLDRLPTALHRCRDKAAALGRNNASERLASFLLTMAERIGRADEGTVTLDLKMSRKDIGDSLGLTIETVSRQISALRTAGLVETEGRSKIILIDTGALKERAGHPSH